MTVDSQLRGLGSVAVGARIVSTAWSTGSVAVGLVGFAVYPDRTAVAWDGCPAVAVGDRRLVAGRVSTAPIGWEGRVAMTASARLAAACRRLPQGRRASRGSQAALCRVSWLARSERPRIGRRRSLRPRVAS